MDGGFIVITLIGQLQRFKGWRIRHFYHCLVNMLTQQFCVLPDELADLWPLVTNFIGQWRGAANGLSLDVVAAAEEHLGFGFPAALRQLYLLAGGGIQHGYFRESEGLDLVPPKDCRFVGSGANEVLLLSRDYHGTGFGVRKGDLQQPNPSVAFVENIRAPKLGVEYDISSLSEFLVGLLFRSAVGAAALTYQVPDRQPVLENEVAALLRSHFRCWQRNNNDDVYLFPVAWCTEGPGVISSAHNERLTIGVLHQDAFALLPSEIRSTLESLG